MKRNRRYAGLLCTAAFVIGLSGCTLKDQQPPRPTAAQQTGISQKKSETFISLTQPRSLKVKIAVALTKQQAEQAAGQVVWSLVADESVPYVNQEYYPNTSKGGALDTWVCSDGETPFFEKIKTGVVQEGKQVYLTLELANRCYFGDDLSVPHMNGGAYLDVCGYFQLTADWNGTRLGQMDAIKIVPYDRFHTMDEINAKLDELTELAKTSTGLYVEKLSMGKTQGDNGLPAQEMPYLLIAQSEAVPKRWQELQQQAQTDPSALLEQLKNGTQGDYQVPVLYSNVHANEVAATDGVLEFANMLIQAAATDGTLSYKRLQGFTEEGKAELARQMGPAGQKGALAVPDLVADRSSFLGFIKGKNKDGTVSDISIPVDLESYYIMETKSMTVDELLSEVFFIIVPEENTEGRTYLTRTSSGGFDLNRDNSFQTQAETQNMARLIAQWSPVSFTEFHGRVRNFQCEPCNPPHEPNFEYDLLAEHLMKGGEALGIAAVANNPLHQSYVIPQRDYLTYTGETAPDGTPQTEWLDPWDDMSTSYTPQYAMLHGTLAYTVEVPAYDDAMVQGVAYGALGQAVYVAEHKQEYFTNQTKIYERGVTNANSNAFEQVGQWFCDRYDIEGAEAALFRPEYNAAGENGNFYPECYIIPMDGENQRNLFAAGEMMEYLARNGVQVRLTQAPFVYQGTEYPTGTLIVSMYQAKRSVANSVLYDGTVITNWPVLYSEGITAFDKTRGFDMQVCAEPKEYESIAQVCGKPLNEEQTKAYLAKRTSYFTGPKGAQVIVKNTSEQAVAAVNQLLKDGHEVAVITQGEHRGSFLCSYESWQRAAAEYLLTGIGTADSQQAQVIKRAPIIYITGKPQDDRQGFVKSTLVSGAPQYNYDRQAMRTLGFTVTDDAAQADLIIGAAALDEAGAKAVQSGTPYLGYGELAVQSAVQLLPKGALVREKAADNAMDALAYVTYPVQSLVTASYQAEQDNILYGYGAGYFAQIPKEAQVLMRLDGSRELLEGFLPADGEHYDDFLNDSVQAISYEGKGAGNEDLKLVLFANSLTNKTHQRDEYTFIANTAFASVLKQASKGAA